MVDACAKLFGRIDILHNNVGIGAGDRGPTSMTEEVWDRIHTTNLKSVMFTCKHVLPVMRAQRSGVIINISSIAAVCSVGIVAYKTSKAAVNAFTQSLAIGNGEFNIRANVIMPGLMNTPMAIEGYVAAGRDREELIAQRDSQVPLGKTMGTGWDVANAALFLASDEARFITGVCLRWMAGNRPGSGSGSGKAATILLLGESTLRPPDALKGGCPTTCGEPYGSRNPD